MLYESLLMPKHLRKVTLTGQLRMSTTLKHIQGHQKNARICVCTRIVHQVDQGFALYLKGHDTAITAVVEPSGCSGGPPLPGEAADGAIEQRLARGNA